MALAQHATRHRTLLAALLLGSLAVITAPKVRAAGASADIDADGIPDATDNCVQIANTSQLDSNGDGFGNRCDPDFDGNLVVNVVDLGILRDAFFTTPADPNWDPNIDLNGDDVVNVIDLSILRSFFFKAPGPIAITFINPAGGDWADPQNWSPAVVPGPTHTVRIDLPPGAQVVYDVAMSRVAGLRSSSDLVLQAGALTVDGDMQVNAQLTLDDGELHNANILVPDGEQRIEAARDARFRLFDVTLGADLNLQNGARVYGIPGLTLNDATVSLDSEGSSTILYLGDFGSSLNNALLGTGEVVFRQTNPTGFRANSVTPRVDGTSLPFVIGPDIAIRTESSSGTIGDRDRETQIQGTVTSVVADLFVRVQGSPVLLSQPPDVRDGGLLDIRTEGPLGFPLDVVDGGRVSISGNWANPAGSLITATGGSELSLLGTSGTEFVNQPGGMVHAENSDLVIAERFRNSGQVTVSGGSLTLGSIRSWSNALGTIDVTNAPVDIAGQFSIDDLGALNTTGNVLFRGEINNTGRTLNLSADLPGNVILGDGHINGGTLTGPPLELLNVDFFTLEGVTLAADVLLGNGGQLRVEDGLILDDAVISLDSRGAQTVVNLASGARVIDGAGEIRFLRNAPDDLSDNVLWANGTSAPLTIGSDITIRTAGSGGRIGLSFGSLVLDGTLVSDVPGRTINVLGANATFNGDVLIGPGASVTLQSDYTFGANTTLTLGAAGNTPDAYGQLIAPDALAQLNGMVSFEPVDGYVPQSSDTFDILTWSDRTGEFNVLALPTTADGAPLEGNYLPNGLRLQTSVESP